jgi:hypothetical protein
MFEYEIKNYESGNGNFTVELFGNSEEQAIERLKDYIYNNHVDGRMLFDEFWKNNITYSITKITESKEL